MGKQRNKCRLGQEMDLGIRLAGPEATQDGCRQDDVADGTEPDDQYFFPIGLLHATTKVTQKALCENPATQMKFEEEAGGPLTADAPGSRDPHSSPSMRGLKQSLLPLPQFFTGDYFSLSKNFNDYSLVPKKYYICILESLSSSVGQST